MNLSPCDWGGHSEPVTLLWARAGHNEPGTLSDSPSWVQAVDSEPVTLLWAGSQEARPDNEPGTLSLGNARLR